MRFDRPWMTINYCSLNVIANFYSVIGLNFFLPAIPTVIIVFHRPLSIPLIFHYDGIEKLFFINDCCVNFRINYPMRI